MVRGLTLTVLAVLSIALAGCERRSADETRVAEAPPPAPAPALGPRVNLYPLSTPPPGSLQPLSGTAPLAYAPAPAYAEAPAPAPSPYQTPYQSPYATVAQPASYTTTTTTTYAPAAYTPSYTPPTPANYTATYTATYRTPDMGMVTSGGYCTVEEMTAASSSYVPMPDPPMVVDNRYYPPTPANRPVPYATTSTNFGYTPAPAPVTTTTAAYTPAATYTTTTASYTPPATTYSAPAYVTPPATTTYAATTSPVAAAPATSATFRLVPAPDVPPGIHPNDAAPSQWFEIVRPGNGPIRIGRVTSTCVCVGVRVPNRYIAAGERALIEARVVSRPPVNNLTYGIYVNVLEPQPVMVDADVTIRL